MKGGGCEGFRVIVGDECDVGSRVIVGYEYDVLPVGCGPFVLELVMGGFVIGAVAIDVDRWRSRFLDGYDGLWMMTINWLM